MKKINYILIALAFVSSLFAIILNFDKGFGYWAWPFATCMWVIDAFVKQRRIDNLESQINENL